MPGSSRPRRTTRPGSRPSSRRRCVQNHAANLTVLANGDLACVWFGGTQEGVPDISVQFSRLPKGGDRWTAPETLSDDPTRSEQNPILFPAPGRHALAVLDRPDLRQPGHRDRALPQVARPRPELGADRDAVRPARRWRHLHPPAARRARQWRLAAADLGLHDHAGPQMGRRRGRQRRQDLLGRRPQLVRASGAGQQGLRPHERAGPARRHARRLLPQPLGGQHLCLPFDRWRPHLVGAGAGRAAEQQLLDPGDAAGQRPPGDGLQRVERRRRDRAPPVPL